MSQGASQKFGRVGVLLGGMSSEREISFKSGEAVARSLRSSGCDVIEVDINTDDVDGIRTLLKPLRLQVAFVALHGALGEDGVIQSVLESMKIPYTGTGVEASRLAMDKAQTQARLQQCGINVPEFRVFKNPDSISGEAIGRILGWPLVVKPSRQGSSIGVSLCRKREELDQAVNDAFKYDDTILIERFISGREVTVGILGEETFPVLEIIPKSDFFDFSSKYGGESQYKVPADLLPETSSLLQSVALQVHRVLGGRHFSRVDFILDGQNRPFVLEINTIPGMTNLSLLPKAAAAKGISFDELTLRILEMAYGETQTRQGEGTASPVAHH